MRLKDIKIGYKLIGGFITTALFILVVGMVGLIGNHRMMNNFDEVAEVRLPSIEGLGEMESAQVGLYFAARALYLADTQQEIQTVDNTISELREQFKNGRERYESLLHTPDEVVLWKKFYACWERFSAENEKVIAGMLSRDPAKKHQALLLSTSKVRLLYRESEPVLHQIYKLNVAIAEHSSKTADAEAAFSTTLSQAVMGLGIVLALLLGFTLTGSIVIPLHRGVAFAEKLEKGDLTARLDVDQKDEVGHLTSTLNRMAEGLGAMVRVLNDDSSALSTAAVQLSAVSEQLNGNSHNVSERMTSVSAAAEEMTVSILGVSSAAEQSSTNANVVATATEEMTSSIGEIAQNADMARQVASNAVASVKAATTQMSELGTAANEISRVIEMIIEIAEQTKLLALNATIEAARAGDAGKGFAVVAGEVKALAAQTNHATQEIQTKIDAMQQTTGRTIQEIDGISQVIHKVDELVASIATAVEEQSIVTREIASNIGQTAQGIHSVTTSVSQTADTARIVAGDVAVASTASGEVLAASIQVSSSAEEISRMGASLHRIVNRFNV